MNEHPRNRALEPGSLQRDLIARLGLDRIAIPALSWRSWAAIAAGAFALLVLLSRLLTGGAPAYVTQVVVRGPLDVTISATGTLAPRDQVDVGAEISGRIDSLAVDFNDHVHKGQVLARINTDQLQAQLAQARATLDQAQATLKQNEDAIRRDRALAKSGAVSPQQLVAAEGDLGRARAGVALASAQVKQDETMLSKATIYSPIDGVVLDKKVSAGQTVVAAMTTPVLFTLASDLSQMELKVDIDEADVGQVHQGSAATFTVDAYPARQFAATLISVHNSPQTVQGVVTYQGVLLVQNREGLLKPGMTATASIEAAHVRDSILVPNGALRYVPADSAKASARPLPASHNGIVWGRAWSPSGGKLSPHDLRLGASDGKQTAVLAGDLKQGDLVVVDTKRP